jgi:hypothetical protein
VATATGTSEMTVTATRATGGGLAVTLAVGPARTPWICEVRPSGDTFAIRPLAPPA